MKKNDVTTFFYYMWNAWSKSECERIFPPNLADHFWGKWMESRYWNNGYGSAEKFYSELDTPYQNALVKRAKELYNGKNPKQQNEKLKNFGGIIAHLVMRHIFRVESK